MKIKFLLPLAVILVLLTACPSGVEPPETNPTEDGVFPPDDLSMVEFTDLDTLAPNARSLASDTEDWYKDQVFYHLWVSAFADSASDANTEGDIQGIIENLDYLQNDLGVTAIWLSPFFESGSNAPNRHNYDPTNLNKVNSVYGTNQNMYDLISAIHGRGMRVIFDHVPNHVSSSHPWFADSASSVNSAHRDWFIWRSSRPSGWTGWDSVSDFHGPQNGSYYYAIFWDGMPDLNYRTAAVRNAMGNAIIYWLNAGFDGLRVDAVKYLYEDWNTNGVTGKQEHPYTYKHFARIREDILEAYGNIAGAGGNYYKFMVAENWDSSRTNLLSYMETADNEPAFNMTLDFPFAYASGALNISDLDSHWSWASSTVPAAGGWMGTFQSNHDNVVSRPMTTFGNDPGKVRLASALQLTGPGTPFIYYGNEIGMTGAAGNDINLRQPFTWSAATTQKADAASLLNWHKHLNSLRVASPALRRGSYLRVGDAANNSYFAFEREYAGERIVVVANRTAGALGALSITLSAAATGADTLFGTVGASVSGSTLTVPAGLAGYGVRIIRLNQAEANGTLIGDIGYVAPPPPDVYLRGTVTNWNPGVLMSRSGDVHSYTLALTAGTHKFKFFDGAWYGSSDLTYDASVGPGDANPGVTTDVDSNLVFTLAAGGSCTFHFNIVTKRYSIDLP